MKTLLRFCALLALAVPAWGSLVVSLTPATLTIVPGNAAIFQGTLIYNDVPGSFLFVNDIAVTFSAPGATYLTADSNFFFQTVPGFFAIDGDPADASYVGPIFKLNLSSATPAGHYFGSVDFLGGNNDPTEANVLTTVNFEVDVLAPEPVPAVLTLISLLIVGLAVHRKTVNAR